MWPQKTAGLKCKNYTELKQTYLNLKALFSDFKTLKLNWKFIELYCMTSKKNTFVNLPTVIKIPQFLW